MISAQTRSTFVARENRRPFSGPCSKTQRRSAGPASRLPGSVFSWCRRAPQGGWEVRRICEARAAGRVVDQNAFDDRSLRSEKQLGNPGDSSRGLLARKEARIRHTHELGVTPRVPLCRQFAARGFIRLINFELKGQSCPEALIKR